MYGVLIGEYLMRIGVPNAVIWFRIKIRMRTGSRLLMCLCLIDRCKIEEHEDCQDYQQNCATRYNAYFFLCCLAILCGRSGYGNTPSMIEDDDWLGGGFGTKEGQFLDKEVE